MVTNESFTGILSTGNNNNNKSLLSASGASSLSVSNPWLDASNDDNYSRSAFRMNPGRTDTNTNHASSSTPWENTITSTSNNNTNNNNSYVPTTTRYNNTNRNNNNNNNNNTNPTITYNEQDEWDTVEQRNQLNYRSNFYRTLTTKYTVWKLRITKFLVRYCLVPIYDGIPTLFYGYYLVRLIICYYERENNGSDNDNDNSPGTNTTTSIIIIPDNLQTRAESNTTTSLPPPPPKHFIITIGIVFVWWFLRTIFVYFGIQQQHQQQHHRRLHHWTNNTNIDISPSPIRVTVSILVWNCRRMVLWITAAIQSSVTIVAYIFAACIYSAIAYKFTKLPSNYMQRYLLSHYEQLAIPTTLYTKFLVPYVIEPSPTSLVHYVWCIVLILCLLEILRIQLLLYYRSFLLFCDEQIENTYYGGPGGFAATTNNIDIIDSTDDDAAAAIWEHLHEPLLSSTWNPTTEDNNNNNERFGIPRWVEQPPPPEEGSVTSSFASRTYSPSECYYRPIATNGRSNDYSNEWNHPHHRSNSNNKKPRSKSIMGSIWKSIRFQSTTTTNSNNDNDDNDNDDDDQSSVHFATIQEEWASLSEEDPFWWSRDDNATSSSNNSKGGRRKR